VIFNSDGAFAILQIEISTGDDNGNNDNGGGIASDDNGNEDNSNSSGGADVGRLHFHDPNHLILKFTFCSKYILTLFNELRVVRSLCGLAQGFLLFGQSL